MNITAIINSIKASLPVGTTEAELAQILQNLGIIPAPTPTPATTPIAPVPVTPVVSSATIEAINNSIDKLIANEAIANNGGNNMNEFTIAGTTASTETTTNLWKTMPAFAPIVHAINDAKCNPITWAIFLTNDFGFEHINIYNDQISELAALTDDTELLSIAPIIATIGTLLKWGDIQELDRKIFNDCVLKYTKYTTLTAPVKKAELLTEVCKTIESRSNILDDDNDYTRWISFISPSFLKDIQTVQKLINISRIGRTNVTKATNANAPVNNTNTNKKK